MAANAPHSRKICVIYKHKYCILDVWWKRHMAISYISLIVAPVMCIKNIEENKTDFCSTRVDCRHANSAKKTNQYIHIYKREKMSRECWNPDFTIIAFSLCVRLFHFELSSKSLVIVPVAVHAIQIIMVFYCLFFLRWCCWAHSLQMRIKWI